LPAERWDWPPVILEIHVLRPLVDFGVLESQESPSLTQPGAGTVYRATPLMGELLSFDV
jgi:hypothetical protein